MKSTMVNTKSTKEELNSANNFKYHIKFIDKVRGEKFAFQIIFYFLQGPEPAIADLVIVNYGLTIGSACK